jgi:hypothetical protein
MRALGQGSVASVVKVGLDIAWVVLWIGAAGFCVAVIAYGVTSALAGAGVLADGAFEQVKVEVRSGQVVLIKDGRVLDWRVLTPLMLVIGVVLAGSLAVVWRLKRLFRNFTSGEPFSADNARHMRAIWIILVGVEMARYAIMGVLGVILLSAGTPEGVSFDFRLSPSNLTSWLLILILIVLAEVFREGARLREEEKLTI